MTRWISINPGVGMFGSHDSAAALFERDDLVFAIEEERLSRRKHAPQEFPDRSIRTCLDAAGVGFEDVDRITVPWEPSLLRDTYLPFLKRAANRPRPLRRTARLAVQELGVALTAGVASGWLERRLAEIDRPVPPIEPYPHHLSHAASASYPAPFDEGLVITLDGRGERASTVVWQMMPTGLERLRTFYHPNSLGLFYAAVTKFLGFRPHYGEGKVMGLAPYGAENPAIESTLRDAGDFGPGFDVRDIVVGTARPGLHQFEGDYGFHEAGVRRLEKLFGRDRKDEPDRFTPWERDLAYVTQQLLEETVAGLVRAHVGSVPENNVAIAGGVGLNSKLNQHVRELPCVDDAYFQPVAHDAGASLGAGILAMARPDRFELPDLYLGPEYRTDAIVDLLSSNGIEHSRPANVERTVAADLAAGKLVGWFQGRLELGPRALGNRSILGDPRSEASRERMNEFVKHREAWRPFAPTVLADAADRYLVDPGDAPFMIETAAVEPSRRDEIPAVIHPANGTARPQVVTEAHNPRFFGLIEAFEELTGVPALLNTSFNDHGEPIVTTPTEAIKDFYGMGLDVLVLEDIVVRK